VALMAEDLVRQDPISQRLYDHGLALVGDATPDADGVFVDCAKGKLVRVPNLLPNVNVETVKASDQDVLGIVSTPGWDEKLDARQWMNRLFDKMRWVTRVHYETPELLSQMLSWKAAVVHARNLGTVFSRSGFDSAAEPIVSYPVSQ
jgi:hypothetical protein